MEDPLLTELKALVIKRRWSRNIMRTNLGGATHYRNGWKNLVEVVYSNTERGEDSKIVQLCRELLHCVWPHNFGGRGRNPAAVIRHNTPGPARKTPRHTTAGAVCL